MINVPEKIPVYMPDEDAKKYILFLKHYDMFDLLLKKGVFEQRNASITLHFDSSGILQAINRSDILFSKRFEHIRT